MLFPNPPTPRPLLERGQLTWDIVELAAALRVSEEMVEHCFRDDARAISAFLEWRVAHEVLGGSLPRSRGGGFDVRDDRGREWEIRSVGKHGTYFCPSRMLGSGRTFLEEGFLAKLTEVDGFVLVDVLGFPALDWWKVPADQIRSWWEAGLLGSSTRIARSRLLALLEEASAEPQQQELPFR